MTHQQRFESNCQISKGLKPKTDNLLCIYICIVIMSVSEKIRHRVQVRQLLALFSSDQIVGKDENHSAIAKELS